MYAAYRTKYTFIKRKILYEFYNKIFLRIYLTNLSNQIGGPGFWIFQALTTGLLNLLDTLLVREIFPAFRCQTYRTYSFDSPVDVFVFFPEIPKSLKVCVES